MSFPYMNPHSIIFVPNNASEDISMLPIFTPVRTITITGVSVTGTTGRAGTGGTDEIRCQIIQLANASNKVATLLIDATHNLTANTPMQFTINSTLDEVAAGTVLGINVAYEDSQNAHFGTTAVYQIDYVQGAPGAEG